jgi:cytochrome c peroxidase
MIKLFLFVMIFYLLNANEPITPLRVDTTLSKEKIVLGEKLFFDTRLSKDNSISCVSCHVIELGGVDNLPTSFGVNGAQGIINTPTVLNSSLNFVQFWDGRARTLTEQIEGPIHNTIEMSSNWNEIIHKLTQDPNYVKSFKHLYRDSIKSEYIKDALVVYQKSLITPSRFDRYLLGDKNAITPKEQQGYALFKSYGCSSCHQGQNVGGNMYEKLGVFKPYFKPNKITPIDKGRYNLTQDEDHLHEFKVPSLRNVALTAPYFHNGSIKTLKEAVEIMAEYQIGQEITPEEIEHIVAFLKSLTWENLEK